jgi:predicted NBD/HSP70 family sugar kinase
VGETAGNGPLRSTTRLRLLDELYRNPATSRSELVRRTGLSRATVSSVVDELERAGLVGECAGAEEERPRNSGRPPILLSLVRDAAFAVGLDFGHTHIRVAICDLAGQAVVDDWALVDVDHAAADSLDLAHDLVREALRTAGIDKQRLLGIGMGVAAPINKLTGELEAEQILPGWHGIRPAAEMERRLGMPVRVENDANVGALGEHAFGAAQGFDQVIYVRLSAGIGAGLILNGNLYQGALGTAGEIGHSLVEPAGEICRCGNRGCLETVASPVALAAMLTRRTGSETSVQRLLELVAENDRGARRAVADAGETVGTALSRMVNLLNPEIVVVGGELAAAGSVVLDPLRAAMERHSIATASSAVQVVMGTLGDRAEVLGAAGLILAGSPEALARRVVA